MKGSSFKKLFNNVTHNPVLLYFLLVVAVFNLLAYLQTNNLAAIVLFLVTGYVTTLYTKNMSVVLLSAIMITSVIMCLGYLNNLSLREGLTDKNGKNAKNGTKKPPKDDGTDTDDTDTDDDDDKKDKPKVSVGEEVIKLATTGNELGGDTGAEYTAPPAPAPAPAPPSDGHNCKPGQHWDERTKDCVANSDSVKNGKNKGGFANIEEADFSLSGNPTMNYRGTVENAFGSLEKLLGSDGLNKMSLDTANLATKQDQLIEAMNKMEPMMNTASKMMEKFQGMKGIGNLFGGSNNE